jgi:hypothetical protein
VEFLSSSIIAIFPANHSKILACINALRSQKAPGLTNVLKTLLTELISKLFPCPEKPYRAWVCVSMSVNECNRNPLHRQWVGYKGVRLKKEKIMSNILRQSVWMYRTTTWFWNSLLRHTQYFYVHSLLMEGTVVFVTHVNRVNIFRLRAFTITEILDSCVSYQ